MAECSAAPPKLTCENVMTAVKGVWWYSVGIYLRIPKSKLDEIDRLYSDDSKRCQALIQYWMGLDPFPTWRRVITALGGMLFGEGKERADRIRAYAEPQTDPTLTLHNVTTAIATVEWDKLLGILAVPHSNEHKITSSCSTLHEKKQAVVLWWLKCAPGSSWACLAHGLYRREENAALQQTLKYLKRPTDATLTLSNLSSALEAVNNWNFFGSQLGVSRSVLNQFSEESSDSVSCRQMMLRDWITAHPVPSWDIVTELLYQGGRLPSHPKWHSILMEVKKLYGK